MTTLQTTMTTELVWTPDAWEKFKEIRDQAARIHGHWGEALGDRAQASIAHCLANFLASGRTEVFKAFDYDGLLFVTPYITCGMVFHADSAEYMAKRIRADATAEEVEACFKFAPPSGEWSLHS